VKLLTILLADGGSPVEVLVHDKARPVEKAMSRRDPGLFLDAEDGPDIAGITLYPWTAIICVSERDA
jgi:hypothetical protein